MKSKNYINIVVLINVLYSNKCSILIMTIQNWKVVEDYPKKFHKIDVKKLDEDTSLKLFTTYSCRNYIIFSKEFIEVGKQIVKSCNGPTLNLKVTRSF